jgi:MFS family permease
MDHRMTLAQTPAQAGSRTLDMRVTVLLLATCQALTMSSTALIATSSALAGKMLSADGALATLPLALQYLSAMFFASPVSFWMQRVGRRLGFMTGAGCLVLSGTISATAIFIGSFELFCFASLVFGMAHASAMHFRFAAAESASEAFRPKAISLVLSGGVVAAVLGPNLARLGEEALAPYTFAGGFLFVSVLGTVCFLLLAPLRMAATTEVAGTDEQRSLKEIVTQAEFLPALAAAMLGYGMMVFVMTATPLAMQSCGFDFGETAFILQFHALAMFVPSFVSGGLIRRFGERMVLFAGTGCYVLSLAFGLTGIGTANFLGALIFLGIGWNFLFVAGTSLLTKCYRPSERGKVQAFNETMVLGWVALSSLVAGAVEFRWGWEAVLGPVIVPLALVMLVTMRMRVQKPLCLH